MAYRKLKIVEEEVEWVAEVAALML